MIVRKTGFVAMVATLVLSASPAMAALDLFPAAFRGLPGSVYAAWDFESSANPSLADAFEYVPLQDYPIFPVYPFAELLNLEWGTNGNDGGWRGLSGTVYDLPEGGVINIAMPNFIDFEPLKLIWIQISYAPSQASPFTVAIEAVDNEVGEVLGTFNGAYDDTTTGYRVESWSILPNPDFELIQIYVPSGAFVNSVVVDTISTVPEVSTLALSFVGLASVGIIAYRRRRSKVVS